METKKPPTSEKLGCSIVLTIPMVILLWAATGWLLSCITKYGFLFAIGIAWWAAVELCQGIYKRHGFPPGVSKVRGFVVGTIVTLSTAVTIVTVFFVGCGGKIFR